MKNSNGYYFDAENVEVKKILKNNKKVNRILESITVLGEFNKKIPTFVYEIYDNDDYKFIKLYCEDLNENIFVFYVFSSQINDMGCFEMISNISNEKYDVKLAKKYEITNDNICLLKSGIKYDFRYGRLMTNEKSCNNIFYTFFLPNDISVQLNILYLNDDSLQINSILSSLNKLCSVPNLFQISSIFSDMLLKNDIKYQNVSVMLFNKFNKIKSINIYNEKENGLSLKKNIDIK